jgi:4-hydroxy-tetrahydrodipicolinate synthase
LISFSIPEAPAPPMRSLFTGSGVALVTPFASDGGLDVDALRDLARWHLREGTDALVVNGSTGEAATMTPEEQSRVVAVVAEEAAGRIPVIAGAGGSDTAAVARLARSARDAGADAILLAPPPYNKPTQRGIVAHFRAVLDAADLPLMVYNVPSRTACNILPATVAEIAEDERVAGVKEASADISQIAELARVLEGRVAIYSGNDDQTLPILALGGVGVVTVLGNILPGEVSRMVRLFLDGALEESRGMQLSWLPLIAALFREPNPVPVKAAMREIGLPSGSVRLPLLPASDETIRELTTRMAEVGLARPAGA